MAKVWKAYVGQLKEKLDLINETLALTQKTGVAHSATLASAIKDLRSLITQTMKGQVASEDVFKVLSADTEHEKLGIIATGVMGEITKFNAKAGEILGTDFLISGDNQDEAFFLADKVTPSGRNLPWRRAAEGIEVNEANIFFRGTTVPDGLWLRVCAFPVKDSSGSVRCAVAIFDDITEEVLAENHIRDVRRALEQRLTATSTVHEELAELAGKLGQHNWDILDSLDELVLVTAETGSRLEKLALVVDDVQVHHVLLGSYLNNLGFTVHSANNGQAAVEAALKNEYSLILMDCDMPVMDGFEATKEIRKNENQKKRVPIIAMTIYDRAGDREKCLAAGMDEYVTKSIDQTKLFKVAAAVLKGEPIVAQTVTDSKADPTKTIASEFDLKSLSKLYGKKAFTDIVPSFLKTSTILIECLKTAVAERDVRATHHYAYCIKGPAASLGCTKLASLCETMAAAALRNKWFDADFELDSLESSFEDIAKQFETLVDTGELATASEAASAKALARSNSSNSWANSTSVTQSNIKVMTSDEPGDRIKKLEKKVGQATSRALALAFLEDSKDVVDTMAGAIVRNDTEVIKKAMHKLGGCCASMMDSEGQRLAKNVEDLAIEKSWTTASSVYSTLCESLLRTRAALENYTKEK